MTYKNAADKAAWQSNWNYKHPKYKFLYHRRYIAQQAGFKNWNEYKKDQKRRRELKAKLILENQLPIKVYKFLVHYEVPLKKIVRESKMIFRSTLLKGNPIQQLSEYRNRREIICKRNRLSYLRRWSQVRARKNYLQRKHINENPEKFKILRNEYYRKCRESLSDVYCKRFLLRDTSLKSADVPEWLVDMQRQKIKLIRLNKKGIK